MEKVNSLLKAEVNLRKFTLFFLIQNPYRILKLFVKINQNQVKKRKKPKKNFSLLHYQT